MKTLTYSETSAFFKELDQAVKMHEPVTIQVQEDAPVGSELWTRLKRCKGFTESLKKGGAFRTAVLEMTGVEDFLTLLSMLGGCLTFLAYSSYKKYRVECEAGCAPFKFRIKLDLA